MVITFYAGTTSRLEPISLVLSEDEYAGLPNKWDMLWECVTVESEQAKDAWIAAFNTYCKASNFRRGSYGGYKPSLEIQEWCESIMAEEFAQMASLQWFPDSRVAAIQLEMQKWCESIRTIRTEEFAQMASPQWFTDAPPIAAPQDATNHP